MFWFVLGREPLLSTAEIFSVLRIPFGESEAYEYQPSVLRVSLRGAKNERRSNPLFDPNHLINRLGGTIKIGQELGQDLSEEKLLDAMIAELETIEGKLHFGISLYSPPSSTDVETRFIASSPTTPTVIEDWGKEIKKRLKEKGRSVRYIFKDELTLSSVTVEKNGLVEKGREFLVYGGVGIDCNQYLLAKTTAVQPFEQFSARDFNRPGRDARSGMLPPKLAMMMINLADNSLAVGAHGRAPLPQRVLLDPFCGSGTILTEAILLGYKNIIGTDISDKAVIDTKQNLNWTISHYNLKSEIFNLKILQGDITNLSNALAPESIDAIVTEPFLGPPLRGRETVEQIKKTALELNHLYFQSFKEFKKILRPGGVVVFIFPRFLVGGEWVTISNRVVPDIQKLGFTVERLLPEKLNPEPFVLYHRDRQRVGREIWKFTLRS